MDGYRLIQMLALANVYYFTPKETVTDLLDDDTVTIGILWMDGLARGCAGD